MNTNEMLAAFVMQSQGLLQNTLSDFSDADMLKRPVPSANHAAWQLGHLATSTWNILAGADSSIKPPANFKNITRDLAKSDNPGDFPNKTELLAQLAEANAAAAKWMKTLPESDYAKPSPETVRGFAPTLFALALLFPQHMTMHVGQFQVIRRTLNKPVLF